MHFCGKTCVDEAASRAPMILAVPEDHVTFRSGTYLADYFALQTLIACSSLTTVHDVLEAC